MNKQIKMKCKYDDQVLKIENKNPAENCKKFIWIISLI